MPGVEGDNETGFWESLDVYRLNDEILASGGSRWDDWRSFRPTWHQLNETHAFKTKALEILSRDFGRSSFFVLKDPRICRLLPFWSEVLLEFGVEAKHVIPMRNPMEVAASLAKRDGLSHSASYLLWLRHVLDAEYFSRGYPRAVITYQGLLDDWRSLANALELSLGIHWARRGADMDVQIDSFLERRHRHHALSDSDVYDNPELVPWVKEAYSAFGELQADPESAAVRSRLDGLRQEFDRASEAFGAVVAAEETARKELAAAHSAQARHARDILDATGIELDALHREAASRDQQIRSLTQALVDVNAGSASRHTQIETLNARVIALANEASMREQQVQSLTQTLAKRDEQLIAVSAESADRHAQIQSLNQGLFELKKESESRHAQILTLNQTLIALKEESASRQEQIEALRQIVAQRDKESAALNQSLAAAHAQIAELFSSTSWRVTAPIRALLTSLRGMTIRSGR